MGSRRVAVLGAETGRLAHRPTGQPSGSAQAAVGQAQQALASGNMASPARPEPAIGDPRGNGPWEEEWDGWGDDAATEPAAVNERREGAEAWAEEREMLLFVARLTLETANRHTWRGPQGFGARPCHPPCGTGSAGA